MAWSYVGAYICTEKSSGACGHVSPQVPEQIGRSAQAGAPAGASCQGQDVLDSNSPNPPQYALSEPCTTKRCVLLLLPAKYGASAWKFWGNLGRQGQQANGGGAGERMPSQREPPPSHCSERSTQAGARGLDRLLGRATLRASRSLFPSSPCTRLRLRLRHVTPCDPRHMESPSWLLPLASTRNRSGIRRVRICCISCR